MAPTDELMTPMEVAERFRLSVDTVYRLVRRREIPFVRISGSLRFHRADVEAYLRPDDKASESE